MASEKKTNVKPVVLTVFLAYLGQMLLNPIIAPLSREMGLQEWHIGATISLSAATLALCSPLWGTTSQRYGVKRILTISMIMAAIALALFGFTAYAGIKGALTGTMLVIVVVITRGVFYGGSISAVAPSAQAYLVNNATTEDERVQAVSAIGAAQGISGIVGGVVGGALAAIGGLMLPIVVMPFAVLVGLIVLIIGFTPQTAAQLIEKPQRISYFDPRVLPYLISGFCLFLVFSGVQIVFGFTIQDRFSLSSSQTAAVTAGYLVLVSVTMVIVQAGIAPKLGWSANTLLRRGLGIILLGTIALWPVASYSLLAVSCLLIGVGCGLAMPGYNAGPTMQLNDDEQGSLAGTINANNGITYAIAPIAATALYGWNQTALFVCFIVIMLGVWLFTFSHAQLSPTTPTAQHA